MPKKTTPVQIPPHIRSKYLTPELLKSLDKVYRPKPEEFMGLVQAICRAKEWHRTFLCALIGLPAYEIKLIERGLKKPSVMLMRVIWFLYTLDAAPEEAFSLVHIATWGKVEKAMPKPQVALQGEARKAAIKLLADCKASGYKLPPRELTARQLAAHYNISVLSARNLAREANYHLKRRLWSVAGQRRSQPLFMRPESIWMHVDWRLKDQELADKVGCKRQNVGNIRRKFKKIGNKILRRHIRGCGSNPDFFLPFISIYGPGSRYRKDLKKVFDKRLEKELPSAVNEHSAEDTQHETGGLVPGSRGETAAAGVPGCEVPSGSEGNQILCDNAGA